jgi:protein phosphatase
MGGHTHGAKASEIAIRVVEDAVEGWMEEPAALDEDQLRIECRKLFDRVDQAIDVYVSEHPDAEGMGTTLVMAVALGAQVYVAHIGDSRAYWIGQDGTVTQLTQDHSAAAEAIREGRMTEEEVAGSAFQHALTRSLDGSGDSAPDFGVRSVRDPGFLLLCSDGLSGSVGDKRLAEELLRSVPLADSSEALVEAALDQGSEDNISLAVLECGTVERNEEAPTSPPLRSRQSSDDSRAFASPQPPASPQPSGKQKAPGEQQPPGGQPTARESSSQSVRGASPSRRDGPTKQGAPQWATALLGMLVLATLGLGGWAEYRYDLVGLFPEGTASGNTSVIADAGGEADPDLPDSGGGDGTRAGSADGGPSNGEPPAGPQDSTPPADEENQAQAPEENDPSSRGQEESEPPADIADPEPAADEEASDGPSRNVGEASASESSQTSGESSAEQAAPAGSDGAGADGTIFLNKKRAQKEVPEGESREQIIPHEEFDTQKHRITKVAGTDRVGSEITLDSGARLRVEPNGRFSYDPNGVFEGLDEGKRDTDQFTYTAVNEPEDWRLRGTVEVLVVGENTAPTLERNEGLRLDVGQVGLIRRRNLEATDPDDEPGEIRFRVREGPTRGQVLVGDDTASADMDSSFTQQDIMEGRVFYEDTTGEAGTDTLTFAVRDEEGAGPEKRTGSEKGAFQVSVEAGPGADAAEADNATSGATETASSEEGDCRIQFAATPLEGPDDLPPEDARALNSEVAKRLQSEGVRVTVKYAENKKGAIYGLFSERSGTRSEMEKRMTEEDIQSVIEGIDSEDDSTFVHCFP